MWYKNGGLICDIVVSPEKKRNQQSISSDYWFITMFFWQIQSASFPLNPPWCAPFYHGTNPQINFLFLVFFLLVPYFWYSFQRSKNNLLGGFAAPKFCNKSDSPTQNARNTTKSKDYGVAQKYSRLITVFRQSGTLSGDVSDSWFFLPLWRAMTARVALFRPTSERCTMNHVYQLVDPMWNNRHFPKIKKNCRVEMCAG